MINFSKEEIRKVKLELQSINSFGELSTKINSLEIIRKKDDSKFTFGEMKKQLFLKKMMWLIIKSKFYQ